MQYQKIQVKSSASSHSGRTGYFMFYGRGASQGIAVLSAEDPRTSDRLTLFAVSVDDLEELQHLEEFRSQEELRRENGRFVFPEAKLILKGMKR